MDKNVFYSKMVKLIDALSDDEVVSLHNACVKENGGALIFPMWEVTKFMFPYDLKAGKKTGVGFNLDNYYFVLTETGMPRSFSDLSDPFSPFDAGELISTIYDRKCSYGFDEIQSLLDSEE